MKLPGRRRGESEAKQEGEAKAAAAPPAGDDAASEKVSVPFGKPAAPAKPAAKAKAKKAKPEKKPKVKAEKKPKVSPQDDRKKVEEAKTRSRRTLALRVREAGEKKPDEDASQRSEKRRRAKAAKRPEKAKTVRAKAAEAGTAVGGSLKEGTDETRKRTRSAAPELAKGLLKLSGAFFAIFFNVLGVVLNVLLAVIGPARAVLVRLRRIVDGISRMLTPARALALAVAGAAVLLALSQFADYRSVSIGTDAYSGVETVAPAPVIEREVTGDAHSYAFVPVAVVSLLLLIGAMLGRWKLCRLIAIGGIAAIVVGLLVDRPAGLDPGEAAQAFDGVEGALLGGFYAQLFAGALLAVSALLLARELRLQANATPVRAARASRRKQRLRLPRPGRGTEEARA